MCNLSQLETKGWHQQNYNHLQEIKAMGSFAEPLNLLTLWFYCHWKLFLSCVTSAAECLVKDFCNHWHFQYQISCSQYRSFSTDCRDPFWCKFLGKCFSYTHKKIQRHEGWFEIQYPPPFFYISEEFGSRAKTFIVNAKTILWPFRVRVSSKTTSAPAVFNVLTVAKYYLGVQTFQMINGFMDFGYTNIYIPRIFCLCSRNNLWVWETTRWAREAQSSGLCQPPAQLGSR